ACRSMRTLDELLKDMKTKAGSRYIITTNNSCTRFFKDGVKYAEIWKHSTGDKLISDREYEEFMNKIK
ncbi:MAG: hypothetical protein FWG92_07415, partial [Leptospirales bacterium]|nr:hypothetical protein [Leptospirales bacterium]